MKPLRFLFALVLVMFTGLSIAALPVVTMQGTAQNVKANVQPVKATPAVQALAYVPVQHLHAPDDVRVPDAPVDAADFTKCADAPVPGYDYMPDLRREAKVKTHPNARLKQ